MVELSIREGHTTKELVSRAGDGELASLELVDVNPILDGHNRTAELAASALRKRIL